MYDAKLDRREVLRRALLLPFFSGAAFGAPRARGFPAAFLGEAAARGHRIRGVDAAALPIDRRESTDVLVLGAGFAGLAAARALRIAGVEDFIVVESDDVVGGLAQRRTVNGVPVAFGPAAFDAPSAASPSVVVALFDELGLVGAARRLKTRRRVDGAWIEGDPDGSWARLAAAVSAEATKIAVLSKTTPKGVAAQLGITHDERLASHWLQAALPQDAAAAGRAENYARARFGARLDLISAGAFLSDFHRRNELADGRRIVPEGGVGVVAERLAADCGARVRLGQAALRASFVDGAVRTHVIDVETNRVSLIVSRAVVVAIPPFAAREVCAALGADGRFAELPPSSPWLQTVVKIGAPPAAWDGAADLHAPGAEWPSALITGVAGADGRAAALLVRRPYVGRHVVPPKLKLLHAAPEELALEVASELRSLWPDREFRIERADMLRLGHGPARPVPGTSTRVAPRLSAQLPPWFPCGADWTGLPSLEAALGSGDDAGVAAAAFVRVGAGETRPR